MKEKLKCCPCGKTPSILHLTPENPNRAYASGDCCGEWLIEFRTAYRALDSEECMERAVFMWNNTPRGEWK